MDEQLRGEARGRMMPLLEGYTLLDDGITEPTQELYDMYNELAQWARDNDTVLLYAMQLILSDQHSDGDTIITLAARTLEVEKMRTGMIVELANSQTGALQAAVLERQSHMPMTLGEAKLLLDPCVRYEEHHGAALHVMWKDRSKLVATGEYAIHAILQFRHTSHVFLNDEARRLSNCGTPHEAK